MRRVTSGAFFVLFVLFCPGLTGGSASAGSYYGGGYYDGGGYYPPPYPQYGIVAPPSPCCNRGFSCYPASCGYYGPAPAYRATPFYQNFNGPCPIVLVPDGRGGWVWGADCNGRGP